MAALDSLVRPVTLLSWLNAGMGVGFIYRTMSPLPSRYSLPIWLYLPQLFQVSQNQGSAFCVQPPTWGRGRRKDGAASMGSRKRAGLSLGPVVMT